MKYRIRFDTKENKTYYVGMCRMGPKFGGSYKEAETFDSKAEALSTQTSHWAFTTTKIEEETSHEK